MEEASRTSFFIFASKNDNVIQKSAKNRPFLSSGTASLLVFNNIALKYDQTNGGFSY